MAGHDRGCLSHPQQDPEEEAVQEPLESHDRQLQQGPDDDNDDSKDEQQQSYDHDDDPEEEDVLHDEGELGELQS
eukprot:5643697-Heterocapsa_arctica.AAC.1